MEAVMRNRQSETGDHEKRLAQAVCSRCGAIIKIETLKKADRVCLFCHARLLNEYLQLNRQRESGSSHDGRSK